MVRSLEKIVEASSYVCDVGRKGGSDRDILRSLPDDLFSEVVEKDLVSLMRKINGKKDGDDTFFVPESFIAWAKCRMTPPDSERGYLISSVHRACCSCLRMTNFSMGVWNYDKTRLVTKNIKTWAQDIVLFCGKDPQLAQDLHDFADVSRSRIDTLKVYRRILEICEVSDAQLRSAERFHSFLLNAGAKVKNDSRDVVTNATSDFKNLLEI